MTLTLEPTLHRDFYLTDAIFQREKERIFCREWFCAGREEEVPDAADYLLLDVSGKSLFVVRTREGELGAHYNVCRHRGSQLVIGVAPRTAAGAEARPSGSFGSGIRCPYHAWTYNFDGTLRAAPFLEDPVGGHQGASHLLRDSPSGRLRP